MNNLQKAWNDLDKAYEYMENAIETLSKMNAVTTELENAIEKFDMSEISYMKQLVEERILNKWQKVYCDTYYKGKFPQTKDGIYDIGLLSGIKNRVAVEHPDFNGIHGLVPAHTEILTVTENDCDIPNGKISVAVLIGNLRLWMSRGYKIYTQ